MIKKSIVILGVLGLLLAGCSLPSQDDKLNLVCRDQTNIPLRLDGFYYLETQNIKGPLYDRYLLYNNGVTRYGGASPKLNSSDDWVPDGRTTWGIYEVEGNTIRIEFLYPNSLGPLKAIVEEGKILNDTTFHIEESYRLVKGVKTELKKWDQLYHFYPLDVKPDSTNRYVK